MIEEVLGLSNRRKMTNLLRHHHNNDVHKSSAATEKQFHRIMSSSEDDILENRCDTVGCGFGAAPGVAFGQRIDGIEPDFLPEPSPCLETDTPISPEECVTYCEGVVDNLDEDVDLEDIYIGYIGPGSFFQISLCFCTPQCPNGFFMGGSPEERDFIAFTILPEETYGEKGEDYQCSTVEYIPPTSTSDSNE